LFTFRLTESILKGIDITGQGESSLTRHVILLNSQPNNLLATAAMSASGGELNSLATATVIDFYKRHVRKEATDGHYVFVSRLATFAWGLFACFVAMRAANQGSLIEVVNRYGSVVYGSLLGVFILAILTRRATARGAFWGTIAGMAAVLYVYNWMPWIAFLWHNLIGAVVVVAVGMAISYLQSPDARPV